MTTGLFLLRAFQMGLRFSDLNCLEWGQVFDMMTELSNDECEYTPLATQADFDAFLKR